MKVRVFRPYQGHGALMASISATSNAAEGTGSDAADPCSKCGKYHESDGKCVSEVLSQPQGVEMVSQPQGVEMVSQPQGISQAWTSFWTPENRIVAGFLVAFASALFHPAVKVSALFVSSPPLDSAVCYMYTVFRLQVILSAPHSNFVVHYVLPMPFLLQAEFLNNTLVFIGTGVGVVTMYQGSTSKWDKLERRMRKGFKKVDSKSERIMIEMKKNTDQLRKEMKRNDKRLRKGMIKMKDDLSATLAILLKDKYTRDGAEGVKHKK